MAKQQKKIEVHRGEPHRRTSIGNSVNSRPTNKHAKRTHKPYRGQGK